METVMQQNSIGFTVESNIKGAYVYRFLWKLARSTERRRLNECSNEAGYNSTYFEPAAFKAL